MPATLAIAALALYLLTGEPLLGRRAHRRLLTALDAGEPGARSRSYLQWVWLGWALLVVTLLATLGIARWTPAQLGLAPSHTPAGSLGGTLVNELVMPMLAGADTALLSGAVLGRVLAKQRARQLAETRASTRAVSGESVLRMLPRIAAGRWSFAALAITAGVTEEVIRRGFGQGLAVRMLPYAPVAVPVVIAALAFGWAHLYQGWLGVLFTAVLGGLLGALYLFTGSLLVPIVLLDLRALLVRVPADAATHTEASPP